MPGKNRARPFLRCDMGRGGYQPPAMPTQNCAVCGARRPRRATVSRFDLVILRPKAEESAFPSPNAPSSVICSANATFPPEGGRFYQAHLGSRAPQSQVPRCHGGRAGSSRPTKSGGPVLVRRAADSRPYNRRNTRQRRHAPSPTGAGGEKMWDRTTAFPCSAGGGYGRCWCWAGA